MTQQDFTATILVDQTPQQAFDAINNVRGWWSESIDGSTDRLHSAFTYNYKDVHITRFKITDLVPGKRVAWHVVDNYFNFTQNKHEWKDTNVIFDISEKNGKTEVRFTHEGLVPGEECYNVCNEAWTHYIKDSLFSFITTGKGEPNQLETEGFNAAMVEKWRLAK